jgi:hypothetical protein
MVERAHGNGIHYTQPRDNSGYTEAGGATHSARPERSTSAKSESEMAWQEWVDARIDAFSKDVGHVFGQFRAQLREHCDHEVANLKRELELTQRELKALREEVGLERGLQALRAEVEQARVDAPKFPAIAARLERGQARLRAELEAQKGKMSRLRTNQSLTDYKLGQLRKTTDAKAKGLEMKFETTVSSFSMREPHPDAAAALKEFAAGVVNNRTLWMFDPGTAGTA